MHYYQVAVSGQGYHGKEALTYVSQAIYPLGCIVVVPLRSHQVLGIVVAKTTKPRISVKEIVSLVIDKPLPSNSLRLFDWLKAYYPATLGSITGLFLPNGLSSNSTPVTSVGQAPRSTTKLPPLTEDQTRALHTIRTSKSSTSLLHGETGTGKTRVYLELAQESLKDGKSVLLLTPEIGLTSPLAKILENSLSSRIIVLHSNLTPKQRRELWLEILYSATPLVLIGPRSALFAPIKQLGLVVVDEAHDSAYKQEQAPRYHALRVASKLAELHMARLVFGTATPLISEYYLATQKGVPIVRMQELATSSQHAAPEIRVVDATNREEYGQDPYLSTTFLKAVKQALHDKSQSLVFLNRRGTARLVLCQNCGWQALCPNCDLPLTYHGDKHIMQCHTCGYHQDIVLNCPACGSVDIIFRSIGTKALVATLRKVFPEARIERFDADNAKVERFESNFEAVQRGEIDILVGTQLLIKGHDLPKLGLVGVVAADSSLYFPDYTADEQTYQLLSQVLGRVGRGHRQGAAVIQTYHPEGASLLAAINKNWDSFYAQQLEERKQFLFPPFYHVMKLSCGRKSSQSAQKASLDLLEKLKSTKGLVFSGPSPAFIEHRQGLYHWQIIVKAKRRGDLISLLSQLPANWSYDLDPTNLL